jgi:dihydrodiol dehydrogenase / D-xylose 1-dehydrogenase (NADP)
LQKLLHADNIIGTISRAFIDFGLDKPLSSLAPTDRSADVSLGAGTLLDTGIYNLTFAALIFDEHPENKGGDAPSIASSMTFTNGADETTSIILNYPKLRAHCICTTSMQFKTAPEFCRIEGSNGSILVGGDVGSRPEFLVVREKGKPDQRMDFTLPCHGFQYEQDAILEDLKAGRKESAIMPMKETLRMMQTMDKIREANGLKYSQDA